MKASRPPRLADWLLFRLASGSRPHSLIGDLHEQYQRGRSSLWYWRQIVQAIVLSTGISLRRNAIALGLFWILGLVLVQSGERLLGGWPASETGQLVSCAGGVLVAVRLRARGALLITAGLSAFSASELLIHLVYGLRAAQGGPTHFAVMGAGLLGVALGTTLARRRSSAIFDASQQI
jgi:hypothetical protein